MFQIPPLFNTSLRFQKYVLRGLYVALFGYCFAIPVMVMYINTLFGDSGYYFYLSIFSSIMGIICTIPISMIADKVDRKTIITVGLGLSAIKWLLFTLVPSGGWFWVFSAFFVGGLSAPLVGTSISAYLLDILEENGREEDYAKEESLRASYGTFVMIGVILLSGILYNYNIRAPFALNALIQLVSFCLFLLSMPNIKKSHHATAEEKVCMPSFSQIKRMLSPRNKMLWLILSSGAWLTVTNNIIFVLQARFIEVNLSAVTVSITLSSIYLFRSLGAWLTHRFFKPHYVLYSYVFFICFMVVIAYTKTVWFIMLAVAISSVARDYVTTFNNIIVTTESPKDKRALVRGVEQFYVRITSVLFASLSGFFISAYSANIAILGIMGYIILLSCIPWIIFMRKQTEQANRVG